MFWQHISAIFRGVYQQQEATVTFTVQLVTLIQDYPLLIVCPTYYYKSLFTNACTLMFLIQAMHFNENGNSNMIYNFHAVCSTPGILTQCLIRYDKLKTQRKLSQYIEGTPGFKAGSNPLRSRFEISQEENNL